MLKIIVNKLNISWLNVVDKKPVAVTALKGTKLMPDDTPFGRKVSKHFYFFDNSAVSGYKSDGLFCAGPS